MRWWGRKRGKKERKRKKELLSWDLVTREEVKIRRE